MESKERRHSRNEALVAYSTLAAACAAAFAAAATFYQANLTEKIALRQLRAYVQLVVDEDKFRDISKADTTTDMLDLNIINVGQTPAYKVYLDIFVTGEKLTAAQIKTATVQQRVGPLLIMNGQRHSAYFSVFIDKIIRTKLEVLEYLRQYPEDHIYFQGVLRYEDLNKNPHGADVCYDLWVERGEKQGSLLECSAADDN